MKKLKKISLSRFTGWAIAGLIFLTIISLSISRMSPDIAKNLYKASTNMKFIALSFHIIYILVLIVSLLMNKWKNIIIPVFMALLCLAASVTGMIYLIIPNIVIFLLLFILIIISIFRKTFKLESHTLNISDYIFAVPALIIGFWYPYWVESPVALNALLFSPMGVVNCPTLIILCGFFILFKNRKLAMPEFFTALYTLWSGFVGIILLKAYIDVVLIATAIFVFIRMGSINSITGSFKEKEI